MKAARYLLGVGGLILVVLASGCITSSESVQPASVPPLPLDNLLVPKGETIKLGDIQGSVGAPSNAGTAQTGPVIPLGPVAPTQVDLQTITIPEDQDLLFITFTLSWATVGPTPESSDLDFQIYDAAGKFVGQAGSLDNPEIAKVRLTQKMKMGEWTTRVVNFSNPPTDYTIAVEGSR